MRFFFPFLGGTIIEKTIAENGWLKTTKKLPISVKLSTTTKTIKTTEFRRDCF